MATTTANAAATGAGGSTAIMTIKIEMTKNVKRIISQAGRGLALTVEYQNIKFIKIH